jgi:putative membrane protein
MGVGMIGMALFWVLVIALVVVAVVALARGAFGTGTPPDRRPERSELDLLKERYVRGEIERDEFEQKKRDVGG